MKVWSGSAWAEKPTKAWSGTAWVAKPVKVWSGSAWVIKPSAGPASPSWQSKDNFSYIGGQNGVTLNKPAGTVDGDILLAHVVQGKASSSPSAPTAPSGWAQIGGYVLVNDGTGFFTRNSWWWKRASGEPSSYTWTFPETCSTEALLQRYNNCVATGNPVDAFATTANSNNPGITTTVANTLLVWLTQNWDATGSLSPPSVAWTERFDHLIYSADEPWPIASATNMVTQSLGGNPYCTMLLALKPLGVSAPAGPTSSLLTSYTPGSDRNDFTGEVGVRLGIGAAPFTVSWIGARRHHANQTGVHTVKLYEWFSQAVQRTAVIDYTGVAVGAYAWTAITPITLPAGSYYALLMETFAYDGQTWCNPGPATYTGMVNVYDSYLYGGLQTGTANSAFIGLDLGW